MLKRVGRAQPPRVLDIPAKTVPGSHSSSNLVRKTIFFQEKMMTGKRCVTFFLLLIAMLILIEESQEITGILVPRAPRLPANRARRRRNHCVRRCRRRRTLKSRSFLRLMR